MAQEAFRIVNNRLSSTSSLVASLVAPGLPALKVTVAPSVGRYIYIGIHVLMTTFHKISHNSGLEMNFWYLYMVFSGEN